MGGDATPYPYSFDLHAVTAHFFSRDFLSIKIALATPELQEIGNYFNNFYVIIIS